MEHAHWALTQNMGGTGASTDADDPAAGLDEPQRVLFNALRDWRSAKVRLQNGKASARRNPPLHPARRSHP